MLVAGRLYSSDQVHKFLVQSALAPDPDHPSLIESSKGTVCRAPSKTVKLLSGI